MTTKAFFYCFLAFIALVQSSYAINGSYKTYLSDAKYPDTNSSAGELTNTFRPKLTWSPSDNYTFYAAYALSANLEKNSSLILTSQTQKNYRVMDLDSELYSSDKTKTKKNSVLVNQNLDRFYMSYSPSGSGFNLNVGRAPVAFGSAKIINPTDVLTPMTYQTLDKEERVGVDTVRMNYSLGPLSLIDAGYVFGDKLKFSESAAFLRLKLNFYETDISTMLMNFKENLLVGLDLARSVGNASVWFENGYVIPKYFNNNNNNNNNQNLQKYFRATLGVDYKLTSSIYSYVEYHYNGAGTLDPKNYIFLQTTIPYKEGGVSLEGVHYLIPGLTYEMSSLWKLTAQFLFNVHDLSMFNNVALEYGLAQDVFLDAGTYLPLGRKNQFVQKSEFGIYPKIFYASLRLYF